MAEAGMAERLIDQYFVELVADAGRWPDGAEEEKARAASSTWHTDGALDGTTVIRVQMWASNRALLAYQRQIEARVEYKQRQSERFLLSSWLAEHGYHPPGP